MERSLRERREGEIHILFKLRARVRHLNSGVEIFSQVEIPQEAAYSIIEVLAEKYGGKPVQGESFVTIASFISNASRV